MNDQSLVGATDPRLHYAGWTGLHTTAKGGFADAVRLLLQSGAEPNAREAGDNTYPLHWAAAHGHLDTVRALLDAGGDVHGFGDLHELDVIGWATYLDAIPHEVVSLLLDRGARHHIISAIAVGNLELIRSVAEQDPEALDRRMSRFEQRQTALHLAMSRKRYDILDLLIELGADLEAVDGSGQTALAVAMLRGDREAMRRLHAAGAKQPSVIDTSNFSDGMTKLADSVTFAMSMITVPDVARTLEWYASIGFTEIGRHGNDRVVDWGLVSFGKAQLMLSMGGKAGSHDVSLWFYTDRVDELYQLLKSRQLMAAQAALAGKPGNQEEVEFVEDIHDPFYGGREFGVRDLNGYALYFRQP